MVSKLGPGDLSGEIFLMTSGFSESCVTRGIGAQISWHRAMPGAGFYATRPLTLTID